MQLTIITVGKLKEPGFRALRDEYVKRLSRFCRLEEVELPDLPEPAAPSEALEKQGITNFLTAEVQMIPQNTVAVEGENLEAIQKMLDLLDEYDDVQEVFHNAELPEEEEEE